MASSNSPPPPLSLLEEPGAPPQQLDGAGLTIGIISTRWYEKDVVGPLVQACKAELLSKGVASDRITCLQVPGAFELPFAASRLIHAKQQHLDAVICIGCMVKDATMAYEFVSEAATMGLMKLNVQTDTPVVCGLLTCHTVDEATQCATSSTGPCVVVAGSGSDETTTKRCNHGVAWAQEAIELAQLKRATAQLMAQKCACVCHCKQHNCKCSCHCKQCKCHACTCKEGTCQCSSCVYHHPTKSETTKSLVVEQFDKALAGSMGTSSGGGGHSCMGCGKSHGECQCENCTCSSCAAKKSRHAQQSSSAASCGGCTKPGCGQCGGQARASGYHGRSSAPLKGEPNSETLP